MNRQPSENATVSHYRILSKLGEGGMGVVYLAQDLQLKRNVALKILPDGLSLDKDRMRRFVQEAQSAASLTHPNIAHVYEIGESDGIHFIAMEYVEGESLASKINGRPLRLDEIVSFGAQIADALNEAHAKGITHRDLKPTNIMITPRGGTKLLDFGLAKIRQSSQPIDSSEATTEVRTSPGLVMGTVTYMSPEQALGESVDNRSDIFSTGTVLYEMTTGRLPFSGRTSTEVIDRILHAEPDAISRLNNVAPVELERIIRKCLQKDRERRYQSARDLMVDLNNLRRDTVASHVNTGVVPTRFRINRRQALTALSLILLALITLSAVYVYNQRKQQATGVIDSIAVLPLVNASGDPSMEYLSDGITESIINSLAQLPNVRVTPRVAVFRYKGRTGDLQDVARTLGVRAILTGKVIEVGDTLSIQMDLIDTTNQSQLWGQKYNRRSSDLLTLEGEIATEISRKLAVKLAGEDQRRLATRYTEDADAYRLYLQGRYYWKKYTRDAVEHSIDYFQQAIDRDNNYALAYSGLADAYIILGLLYLPPKDVFPKAKLAAEKSLRINQNLAAGHISLASCKLFYDWDWVGAKDEAQRAKDLNRAYDTAIEVNTNYDDDHHFYCQALDTLGRPEESIAEMQRALDLDPLSSVINLEVGWSLYIDRKYDESIAQCLKVTEMDPAYVPAYSCLAQAYDRKGMYKEAIAKMLKARSLQGDDPLVLMELGYAYALDGQKGEAQKIIDTLKERSSREYIDPALIGLVYIALDEKDAAFSWLAKAFDARSGWMIWLKVDPKFDPLRSDARFNELMKRVGISEA
jgi:serine/threonine protein kinase/tetratricopeptide (TPR) repeat protein